MNDDTNKYLKKVENENAQFRQAYTKDMEVGLLDLVPNLTTEDIVPDTEGRTYDIEADPKENPRAAEARMFTLDQIQALFNVLLRRSHVRARLTTEEKAIRVLEAKVAELEKWRPDIEERIKKRNEDVNK